MGLAGGRAAGAWITRQAVRRGLLGSSRSGSRPSLPGARSGWHDGAMRPREPSTVLSERLEPSTGIEIRHVRPDDG